MTSERIIEIHKETAYPKSGSVYQALLQVWNECEQDKKPTTPDDSKRIFLVEFTDYKQQKEWRDCFLAINETDVSQKIKAKYEDKFTGYHIADSYNC